MKEKVSIEIWQEPGFDGIILRIDENHEDLHTRIYLSEKSLETDITTFLEYLEHQLKYNRHQLYELRGGKHETGK